MKLIAIGDTHGRTYWKQIVSNIEFDKMVFVGDYFDSHDDISAEDQKSNFEDIIAYKKENKDKVILLFGNHDYHYLRSVNDTYGGFQIGHKTAIQEMLHQALDNDLMQMCYVFENYIFTHAGITQTWLDKTGYIGKTPLESFINDLFKCHPLAFGFAYDVNYSPDGDDVYQSPIWVRPQSLYQDGIMDYIQVVGHTTQSELKIIEKEIVLIDTIGKSGQFLCITDGELSVLEMSGNEVKCSISEHHFEAWLL